MKPSYIVTAFTTVLAGAAIVAVLRSAPAFSRDDVPGFDMATQAPDEARAHAAYQAHLAANDAAAERWRAAHGAGTARDPDALDAQAVADNGGCPEGTQYWRRDRITELCAPLCAGDQDCGPEDGRCRLLDVEERDDAAPIVLVDDTPADEVKAAELDDTKQAPPVRVCDPFWDVEGALDADLVAVAE